MTNLNNLPEYKIIKLIELRMETLSDMTGYSQTSITRITGWSDDTTIYHTLRKIIKTVNYKGVTKEDMIHVFECLGGVIEPWEAKGF